MTVSPDAKICKDCGSMRWRQPAQSTVYGVTYFHPSRDGSYSDSFEQDDYESDWEDFEDPECASCGSTYLEDISDLTIDEYRLLYDTAEEDRPELLDRIRSGELHEYKKRKNKNAKLIGGREL